MSGLGGFIMANQTVKVDAKQPWSGLVKKDQVITIKDTHGQQAIDFLCYDADNTSDRYSATNTVKVQGMSMLVRERYYTQIVVNHF